jgi:hypothetical protein
MKQALIFSLKVWVTAVIIGPVLYILTTRIMGQVSHNDIELLEISIILGGVLSIPSWLLFFIATVQINKVTYILVAKKLIITFIGIVFTLLPFYTFFKGTPSEWSICYCVVIVAGIWFYKLNEQTLLSPQELS